MDNPFDDLPDVTPRGTIKRTLPHAFVHSDKPLELEMRHASITWNPDYANARIAIADDYNAAIDAKDDDKVRSVRNRLFARAVIVGWVNCNGKDGQPLPYTPELGQLLLDELVRKGLRDELDAALNTAMVTDLFRASPAAAAESLGK